MERAVDEETQCLRTSQQVTSSCPPVVIVTPSTPDQKLRPLPLAKDFVSPPPKPSDSDQSINHHLPLPCGVDTFSPPPRKDYDAISEWDKMQQRRLASEQSASAFADSLKQAATEELPLPVPKAEEFVSPQDILGTVYSNEIEILEDDDLEI